MMVMELRAGEGEGGEERGRYILVGVWFFLGGGGGGGEWFLGIAGGDLRAFLKKKREKNGRRLTQNFFNQFPYGGVFSGSVR